MALKRRVFSKLAKWIGAALVVAVLWAGYRAYRTEQAVRWASNLRELSASLLLFANGHGGHYPDHLGDLVIDDPTLSPELFLVPWGSAKLASAGTAKERADQINYGHCSYVYLGAGRTTSDVGPDDVLMFEADGTSPTGGICCLYGDGHGEVDNYPDAIQAIIATLTRTLHPTTLPTTVP